MKLKFLSLAAAVALLASCSGEDDDNIKSADLIGKWYPVSYKFGGSTIPYGDHEECGKDYLEFMANGVFNDVDVHDCETSNDPGLWELDGKKISIIYDGNADTATIKKLTESTMQIEFREDFDDNGTQDKVVATFTSDPSNL